MAKTYRQSVAAIILAPDSNKIWLGERVDRTAWGFPQGGVEAGETEEAAIRRELMEELATGDFEQLAVAPERIRYDFPTDMTFPTWRYAGQEQRYFLFRLGPRAVIDLAKNDHEFLQYRFVTAAEILRSDFSFKTAAYRQALGFFEPWINAPSQP